MKKLFALVIAVTVLSSCTQEKETPSFETTSVIKEENIGLKTKMYKLEIGLSVLHYKGHKYISRGFDSTWSHTEDCTERHHIEASKRW